MKNSNLLNRLLSYSHEKQKMGGMRRYAAMLIMLLTLGVGQMWAGTTATLYYAVGADVVGSNTPKCWFNAGYDQKSVTVTFTKTAYTKDGKLIYSVSVTADHDNIDDMYFKPKGDSSDGEQRVMNGWVALSTRSGQMYVHNSGWTSYSTDASYKVYFARTTNWDYGVPYVYTWNSSYDYNAGFPGQQMDELTGKTFNGKKIYVKTIGKRYTGVKFSNNSSNQTADMTMYSTNADKMYYYDGSADRWVTLQYDVTLDRQSGTTGATSIVATCGSAMPSATMPTRSGYTFGGYYTSTGGNGTKYYNADGSSAANWPSNGSGPTTLYAKWTQSVTLNSNGATSAGTTSVTATYMGGIGSIATAPSKTNYAFGGWNSNNDGTGVLVINASKALQGNKSGWTDASTHWIHSGASTLYATWTQGTTVDKNEGNANTTYTATWNKTSISIESAPTRTGYTLNGYYAESGCSNKIAAANGTLQTNVTVSGTVWTSSGKWAHTPAAATIYAGWTANTYTVSLTHGTGGSGSGTATIAYDATAYTTFTHDITQTGYHIKGWYDNSASLKVLNDDGTFAASDVTGYITSSKWTKAADCTLQAWWDPDNYTVTLDIDEDNHGTIDGKTTSHTVTYNTTTTDIPKIPTAADYYGLDGYYTGQNGAGTKVIDKDGKFIASVEGYTDADSKWIKVGGETLYAYYKQAEITELALAAAIVGTEETDSVTVTPTIDPTPMGTTIVCWEIQYSNGTALAPQPAGRVVSGNTYRFKAPTASATYIIQAKLAKGSTCPADPEDVLSTRTTTFQVAGEHTVTIRYQDSDGRTLQASSSIEARPLTWTTDGDITPPTITGYTFDHWDAGDGVTIKNGDSDPVTTTTTPSIQIKAVYDGTLTAVYNKRNLIYFNNTLGWDHVYVYFYSTSDYWTSGSGSNTGTGASQSWEYGGKTPYYRGFHGEMTRIEGTNIYYWDFMAGAREIDPSYGYEIDNADNVAFTKDNQHGYSYFYNTEAVRRGDFNHSLSMFVPLADQTPDMHDGTKYYSSGYWMNYPENTGYDLLIYNQKAKAGATKLYEFPFEFTEDYTMPMELTVDLEAGQTYGFEIKRADGTYYSTTTTITANTSNWGLYKDQASYCGLQTTAAGDYTFSLFYDGEYRVGVTYPVAVNDYRIVYTDLATWSKTAHTASWNHPSRVITKNSSATETKKDTVSFFWSYGSSPAIKYQTCSAVAAGSASWNAGTAIDVSGFSSVLTKKGVYNFIFEQPTGGGSISLINVEPYTGNFYIRTDCAGSTKWSNFQSTDHQVTYSDYAEKNSGYTHYYTHWVTTGQNVKFCIANDYSQCITDTLVEDKGTVIANITTEGNANAGRLNSGNANIRFMWNQATNKISRAYISGSTNISDRFLVLEGDAKMFDAEGNALSISGLNANEINLVDDQNFVYERTIQVNTGARAKLTAKYNNNVQYFRGSAGDFAEGTTVELLGGEASGKHTMRIVYDFKTNRLVTAYIPSGAIEDNIEINADLMIVREHQEAGQQLLFTASGKLSEVKTVYGVMRFNRYTLNNKEKTGGHSPVADPKSAYERGLYWISFPFNVNLSDVFGFGTYGTHWIIMEYDGAERATEGYWADSKGFWKYVTNRTGKVLEAGKGYVLALDLDLMKDNNTSFWSNNIEQVELYFPSASEVNNIESTNVTTTVESHACTIDRTNNNGADINKNRTKADSHWNIIGIPSYANYGTTLKDGAEGSTITWNDSPYTDDLPFLYEWSSVDNTYSVQSGTTYPFKSMHAYMVQYHGDLYWTMASATPSIVARRTYAEKPQNVELRLELQQNEKKVDQTFVKLSDDEEVSANFAFDEDLCKEYNANKANIYTFIENYIPAAGNTMPMSEQMTVVPVGVKIATDGDYTFSIPDGTSGIGVTLIDNETGIRTSLSALDYTVNLTAGTHDGRFVLEISPIHNAPTGVEAVTDDGLQVTGARKVLIDGILYIVKGDKLYDVRGTMIK